MCMVMEVAKYFNVTKRTMRDVAAAQKSPALKPGGKRGFSRARVNKRLEAQPPAFMASVFDL